MTVSRKTLISAVVILAVVLSVAGYMIHLNGNSLDYSETDVKIVVTGSMDGEPRTQYDISSIPTGSMIFIHKVTDDSFYSSLRVGDVLTFNYMHPTEKKNMVVTHRIIQISETGGVYTYTLAGDSIVDDPTNGSTQVVTSDSGAIIGKVVGVSHVLGVLVTFMSKDAGKICFILIPCIILIVAEVLNIVKILRNRKDDGDGESPVPNQTPGGDASSATNEYGGS